MDEMVRRSPHPAQGDGTAYLPDFEEAMSLRNRIAQAATAYRSEHGPGPLVASLTPGMAQTLRQGFPEAGGYRRALHDWLAGQGVEIEDLRVDSSSRFALTAATGPRVDIGDEPEPVPDFAAPAVRPR